MSVEGKGVLQNSHRTEKIISSLPVEIQICLTVRLYRTFNQICISKVKQQDYFFCDYANFAAPTFKMDILIEKDRNGRVDRQKQI